MNQYDNVNNNNYQEKIFINNTEEIEEEVNQSSSNNLSQLEQDICTLINYLRTNPLDFCNNLIQKNNYKNIQSQFDIVNFLEDIHSKEILLPYTEIPEISAAARNLLNNISFHYKKYNNLNLNELEPTCLNLRTRLSNYGERTGRIFETVLFKMDNPEDIVNHILREEKGRNMLLSYKMKYIGIACDLVSPNLICTVIDIVQDFIPFRDKNNASNINNNLKKTNNEDNYSYNSKTNYGNFKKSYIYNKNNTNEYGSLINNLNYKNNRDNLKLNIVIPDKKSIEISNNIEINNNINDNNKVYNDNININENDKEIYERQEIITNNFIKNEHYKTPKKIIQIEYKKNNNNQFSPMSDNLNNINIKKVLPRRNNSNNINILKRDSKNINNENLNNIKFTMAGRTYKQQQEIIAISKKNLNKSKSVCSFDVNSINSRASNKNKFQRLKHEEKMEILHKINHRNNKTPNSQSPSDKNSDNIASIAPLTSNINNKDYFQKNNNVYEYNNDNKSKKSPPRSYYNQDYDIYSENDKINFYNNNINNKNINYDGTNQTFTDLRSNPGVENNEEYSKNKINEIKNDLLSMKNQLKRELRDEVREEIRNEFNKKLFYENQQKNKPTLIQIEGEYDNQSKQSINNNYYNEREKRNTYEGNNENIYYNKNNNSYFNKNKGKNRSVQKYYYIKNNNNNINNINNTNIFIPDNDSQYSQYSYNYPRNRKSFDWKEYTKNNSNSNYDGMQLKERYKENYENFNYVNNNMNINENNNNQDAMSRSSSKNIYINKDSSNDIKSVNGSYFNEGYKTKNRQEIKKLIKLYNMAKDDQRSKSIIDRKNSYDIINNNKSISNYNFEQNNNNNITNNNDNNINNVNTYNDINNFKINNYNISDINFDDNISNNNQPILKNDTRNNYSRTANNKENNEEEENSTENDFVKGHRFKIKYEKVKPKGQTYKSLIPKPRNVSAKIININNNEKKYINDNNTNNNTKTEDLVNIDNFSNFENENFNNGKEEINKKDNNGKDKQYKIEKTVYKKNYNETTYYNAENIKENKNNKDEINKDISSNNNNNINERLSLTGRFIEDNSNLNLEDNNLNNKKTIDIKNYMDKNIIYKESKDEPIISKSEKMEDNNIVTTITTKTREIFTPDRKKAQNNEYILKRKVQKKQSDLIKEYKKFEKMDSNSDYNYNLNEIKSTDGTKRYNLYNNKIKTKKLSFGGRKTYDNKFYNKTNYLQFRNDAINSPKQFQNVQYENNNIFDNYMNMSPRFNNNIISKTNSYYKKKKYTPYPYYPYESKVNFKEYSNQLKKMDQNNHSSLEKKYIKDPEGNLIETYVKKTRYNDGSVLLEYV